ncbi:DNA-binding protein [Streptomyces boninensis]|uniref:DNA-binding protein n=1 Tax=Streptomyces boninensis TaxID=2039455 RepID=UPI003B21E4D1
MSRAEEVIRTTERLISVDAATGARAALPAARAALRRMPRYGGGDADLTAALAELYEVIGWILFDAGRYGPARHLNAHAYDLAQRSGDRWTGRLVLLNHSMLLAQLDRPRAACATAARVRGPRPLPARVDSLVLVRQAHTAAMLHARRDAQALISRARGRFLDGGSRHDPAWAWWVDEPELTGHHGWVLARLGAYDKAIPLLHQAATAPGPSYRHLFTAKLLTALAGAGAWRDAEALIEATAARAREIGSARTTAELRRTAGQLRTGARVPAALRDAAAYLLETV